MPGGNERTSLEGRRIWKAKLFERGTKCREELSVSKNCQLSVSQSSFAWLVKPPKQLYFFPHASIRKISQLFRTKLVSTELIMYFMVFGEPLLRLTFKAFDPQPILYYPRYITAFLCTGGQEIVSPCIKASFCYQINKVYLRYKTSTLRQMLTISGISLKIVEFVNQERITTVHNQTPIFLYHVTTMFVNSV